MSPSRWILVAGAPCIVGAAFLLPSLRATDRTVSQTATEADGSEEGAPADLADVVARVVPDERSEAIVTAPVEGPTARHALRSIVASGAAEPEPQPPIDGLVTGLVTDADGVPVADVVVRFQADIDQADIDSLRSLGMNVALPIDDLVGVTDSKGVFLFDGTSRSTGGTLRFGEGYLLGGPVVARVNTEVDWQILRLPRIPRQDAVWTVEVVDPEGRPVFVEGAELELVGGFDGVARRPWPHERSVSLGRIVQRGLPRATWRMHVFPEGSITRSVGWTVEAADADETTRLVIEVAPGTYAENVGPTLESDGSSWVDPASGLLDWLPPDRVGVGEPALNRHFAQTLQIGPGPVRDAELRLRLRAMLYNADNDALYLEYLGEGGFAWSARIGELVGRRWQTGASATLSLDLSRLTRPGEEPVDLRPYLEDGRLDVVVQDDTTIEDVSIRVVR